MKLTSIAGYIELQLQENDFLCAGWLKFIEDLKKNVLFQDRSYDPETKVWTIKAEYRNLITALHKKHFVGENQMELL